MTLGTAARSSIRKVNALESLHGSHLGQENGGAHPQRNGNAQARRTSPPFHKCTAARRNFPATGSQVDWNRKLPTELVPRKRGLREQLVKDQRRDQEDRCAAAVAAMRRANLLTRLKLGAKTPCPARRQGTFVHHSSVAIWLHSIEFWRSLSIPAQPPVSAVRRSSARRSSAGRGRASNAGSPPWPSSWRRRGYGSESATR